MKILQSYMARKIDLLSINPFVRRVSKIYNTSETHSVPLRELYDHALIVVTEGKLNFAYKDKTVALGVGETILTRRSISCLISICFIHRSVPRGI